MDESDGDTAFRVLKVFHYDQRWAIVISLPGHSWLLLFVLSGWQLIMLLLWSFFVFYFYLNSHLNHICIFKHFSFTSLTSCANLMCYISLRSLYYLVHHRPSINLVESAVGMRRPHILICILPSLVSSPRQCSPCRSLKAGAAVSFPGSHFKSCLCPADHDTTKRTWSPGYSVLPNVHCSDKSSIS